ncbi:hypothetical protein TNCV_1804771 [Trichonephila clavipes]|nr:hypothetical protein TNCV_1804771 [Trichonephila clavipes]
MLGFHLRRQVKEIFPHNLKSQGFNSGEPEGHTSGKCLDITQLSSKLALRSALTLRSMRNDLLLKEFTAPLTPDKESCRTLGSEGFKERVREYKLSSKSTPSSHVIRRQWLLKQDNRR